MSLDFFSISFDLSDIIMYANMITLLLSSFAMFITFGMKKKKRGAEKNWITRSDEFILIKSTIYMCDSMPNGTSNLLGWLTSYVNTNIPIKIYAFFFIFRLNMYIHSTNINNKKKH